MGDFWKFKEIEVKWSCVGFVIIDRVVGIVEHGDIIILHIWLLLIWSQIPSSSPDLGVTMGRFM